MPTAEVPSSTPRAADGAWRCLLGVDLRPAALGPLAWLRWAETVTKTPPEVTAVHAVRVHEGLIEVAVAPEIVRDHVQRFLDLHQADWPVRIDHEYPAAQALARAAIALSADLIVIGRRSPVDGDSIVRLGAVARRMLRNLPCAVLVCPADLTPSDIPAGPVLLAVHPHRDSENALVLGKRYAQWLKRPLAVVSVLPPVFPPGVTYAPAAAPDPAAREARERGLREWLVRHQCSETPLIAEGPVVPSILAAANRVGAATIVCGARVLTRGGGILSSSVGTAIAGVARVPTLVVPPN